MSVRYYHFFFHFLVNKQTGFHLIDKSARLSPRRLIQLQFGLIEKKRAKYPINLIANTVMCFILSYLQTTGASKIKRELLTNQGRSQLFDMLQPCFLQVASKETGYTTRPSKCSGLFFLFLLIVCVSRRIDCI